MLIWPKANKLLLRIPGTDAALQLLIVVQLGISRYAGTLEVQLHACMTQHADQVAPVAAEEVEVPGEEVEGLAPAHGVVPKVLLHVRHQPPVHAHPVARAEFHFSPLARLLEEPGPNQGAPPGHLRQAAAVRQPPPHLRMRPADEGLF